HARPRAARIPEAERVAHAVEKAALPLLRLFAAAKFRLQFLDAGIGALERLVLQKRRLHQGVKRVRRALRALCDQPLGRGIARHALKLGQTIEQVFYELGFLGRHGMSPYLRLRRLCGERMRQGEGYASGRSRGLQPVAWMSEAKSRTGFPLLRRSRIARSVSSGRPLRAGPVGFIRVWLFL